ncbi:unnamed protein product, partial [Meganyctiphanes norvegica]
VLNLKATCTQQTITAEMTFSGFSLAFAMVVLVPGTLAQGQDFGGISVPDDIRPVTMTVTLTVFGPVNTVTVSSTVTRTQMYNGGITHDVQVTETTRVTKTFNFGSDGFTWVGDKASSQATVTSSVNEGVLAPVPNPLVKDSITTLRPTETIYTFVTSNKKATHTVTHKSTTQEVSVIVVPMTTTLYQTITQTHVDVVTTIITSIRT